MGILKQIGKDFILQCARGQSREAFARYVHKNFKHHNAYFKGDAQTLMEAMETSHQKSPNKEFRILRALEDENLVALHSFVKQDQFENGYVVMHIMRFEGEKIIELWDFGQAVPGDSPNENGVL